MGDGAIVPTPQPQPQPPAPAPKPAPTPLPPKELSVDDIVGLGIVDLDILTVPVPEWGGNVYMRVLPADEGIELGLKAKALPENNQTEALYLVLGACLVTPAGERLFKTTEDAKAKLGKRSSKVLARLLKTAQAHQGWDETTAKKA